MTPMDRPARVEMGSAVTRPEVTGVHRFSNEDVTERAAP